MIDREPWKKPREIRHKKRRVDRHVEDGRSQREPCLLKSPEVTHRATHPGVIAALARQRTRKLANHERGGKAPKQGREYQEQNRSAVAGAVHDVLNAIV